MCLMKKTSGSGESRHVLSATAPFRSFVISPLSSSAAETRLWKRQCIFQNSEAKSTSYTGETSFGQAKQCRREFYPIRRLKYCGILSSKTLKERVPLLTLFLKTSRPAKFITMKQRACSMQSDTTRIPSFSAVS